MNPEQEYDDGQEAWKREQERLTKNLTDALDKYQAFHEQGFESWFHEWKIRRRIK